MSALRFGYVTGPVLGALWTFVIATTVAMTKVHKAPSTGPVT